MFEEDFSPIDSVINENETLWEFKEIIQVIFKSLLILNILELSLWKRTTLGKDHKPEILSKT